MWLPPLYVLFCRIFEGLARLARSRASLQVELLVPRHDASVCGCSQRVLHRGRGSLMDCGIHVLGVGLKEPRTTGQRVARPMRCEIEVQVGHAVAEDVHVYLVGGGGRAQGGGDTSQDRPQRRCFHAVEVGDEGNVAVRFEVSESDHGPLQHH